MAPLRYDPLYVAFIAYFNKERDYFECHEVMERLWLDEGRDPLYQGLLQVAVGLYHHRNGNINGGIKLLTSALEKLAGRGEPVVLGIRLDKLVKDAGEHLNQLLRHKETPLPFRDLTIEVEDPVLKDAVNAFKPGDEEDC